MVRRDNTHRWTKFIAKTGHKWYPHESITEHLLNCIGTALGLRMSQSELAILNGQLRFLSKYFLDNKHQELVHGVDIFAGYVSDREFVEAIENQKLARTFFTFQFAAKAIAFAFPLEQVEIIEDFVKLLVFDAIVGNNDRHFYNWGVVKNVDNRQKPYFSPIFDTARGLFWNDSEQKIVQRQRQPARMIQYLKKYIQNSYPKTGWEGADNLNHLQLIQKIAASDTRYMAIITSLLSAVNEKRVHDTIQFQFSKLLSKDRLSLILQCLQLRFELLRQKIDENEYHN